MSKVLEVMERHGKLRPEQVVVVKAKLQKKKDIKEQHEKDKVKDKSKMKLADYKIECARLEALIDELTAD